MAYLNPKYITRSRAPYYEVAAKYIDKTHTVLDIGAGNGQFADFLQRKDVILYDGNERTIADLRRRGYLNTIFQNLPHIPLASNSVDVIHCSHIVEHLLPEVLYELLKESDRVLKKNGYLIISAPTLWSGFYDDLSHVKPYSPYVFKKYLSLGVDGSTTRPLISNSYNVIEEVYRYKYTETSSYVTIRENIISKLVLHVFLFLCYMTSKLGIKNIERTGFTLVLRKEKEV